MNTNIAESLNSQLVTEKSFPIYSLLQAIQHKLSKWFSTRRTKAANNTYWVTPKVHDMLLKTCVESKVMASSKLNEFEFEVRGLDFVHVVNLGNKTCTCRAFDVDRIPCAHSIAALRLVNAGGEIDEQIERMCHQYYSNENWKHAYEMTLYPVPASEEWITKEDASAVKVLPPQTKIRKGRKRTKRIPSIGEYVAPSKRRRKCSNCHVEGHFKSKCPNKNQDGTSTIKATTI
jgi:SWIM zinc finger